MSSSEITIVITPWSPEPNSALHVRMGKKSSALPSLEGRLRVMRTMVGLLRSTGWQRMELGTLIPSSMGQSGELRGRSATKGSSPIRFPRKAVQACERQGIDLSGRLVAGRGIENRAQGSTRTRRKRS